MLGQFAEEAGGLTESAARSQGSRQCQHELRRGVRPPRRGHQGLRGQVPRDPRLGRGSWCLQRERRHAGPPVWIGGHSDVALRRALRFGDGWYGTGADVAEVAGLRRRLRELAADTADSGRLTLASAAFLTPPGIPAAVLSPGQPLGGVSPTATSVADALGRLVEEGLTACTLWLPVAAEHVEKAMEWIAAEVMPQLA
ncbi:LLM class flavin-dependent oxidoreductase [Amycolatopsis sp. NPDC049253]|uniref:LLM class flavin-dependent oxidoreductase n=1 Tax=Amycolatopsis sp. NPDC049253 TaxID=3155274 RepID=UPI00343FB10C